MYSGRKVSAPNMANPMTKPMALAALKTLSLKSLSGITGSAATRSTKRNATANATPRAAVATLGTETQAHEIPPRLAKMMSDVAEPARSSDPA
jgi:hypothetical protein